MAELDDAIVAAVAEDTPVTLRGVYYRVLSAGKIDKTDSDYEAVGKQLKRLRRRGVIPYSSITDGTRLMRKPPSWSSAKWMVSHFQSSYRKAFWETQDVEVIILSEKEAITGAIYPVTAKWDVELGITRGYSSETFSHSIAVDVAENCKKERVTWIYQLGDHDASGVNGWESLQEIVTGFLPDLGGSQDMVNFERLAVTPQQIEELSLLTRLPKPSDNRGGWTGPCVEVDAIPAPVLRGIVEGAIVRHIDPVRLAISDRIEQEELAGLERMTSGWGWES